MAKYCPIIMVVNAIEESNIGIGLRGSPNPADTVCGEEACALWNENQKKCAIACKYQPEQPNRRPLSKHNAEEEKQHSGLLEE